MGGGAGVLRFWPCTEILSPLNIGLDTKSESLTCLVFALGQKKKSFGSDPSRASPQGWQNKNDGRAALICSLYRARH